MSRILLGPVTVALALCALLAGPSLAQTPAGTAFTYQGQLTDAGSPATALFDFQFLLFDAAAGGIQAGPTLDRPGVAVAAGLFTVSLDFGASPFAGDARWLEIHVRPAGGGAYTTLTPRQPLTPGPYALMAARVVDGPGSGLNADLLDGLNSTQLLRNDTSGVLAGTLTVNSGAGANALLSEAGIDRSVAGPTTLTLQNSDAGAASTMQLQVESGTAAGAPAYSFVGDTDTGIFHPAADTVAVAAGGAQMATIDPVGMSVVKTTLGGAAIRGTGPGAVIGDGVFGVTGTGGRGVVAQNTSSGIALMTLSASGDQLLATTSFALPDPVLRITNAGSVLAEGAVAAGSPITGVTPPPAFNSFGNPANKDEAAISAANDVYVEGGLEVDGNAFVDGVLRIPRVSSLAAQNETLDFRATGDLRVISDSDGGGLGDAQWFRVDPTVASNQYAELRGWNISPGDLLIRGQLSTGVTNFDLAERFRRSGDVEPGDLVRVDPSRPDSVLRTTGEGDTAVLGVVSTNPAILLGGTTFDAGALRAWGDDLERAFLAEKTTLETEVLAERPNLAAKLAGLEGEVASLNSGSATGSKRDVERLAAELEQLQVTRNDVQQAAIERFAASRLAPVALAGRVPVKVDASYGEIAVGDSLTPSPIPGVAMKATGSGPVVGTALEPFSGGRGKILMFVRRGDYSVPDQADKDARIAALEERVAALEGALAARVARLEKALKP